MEKPKDLTFMRRPRSGGPKSIQKAVFDSVERKTSSPRKQN
jgi:hypothetical protein